MLATGMMKKRGNNDKVQKSGKIAKKQKVKANKNVVSTSPQGPQIKAMKKAVKPPKIPPPQPQAVVKKTASKKAQVKGTKDNEVKEIKLEKPTENGQSTTKKRYTKPSKFINDKLVDLCLSAVLKLAEDSKKSNKILEDETAIFAEIHCMKIQNTKGNISFVLPHSTVSLNGEVCLITPDLKKGKKIDHEPTVDHWEEQLRKAGVSNVKTVLPMRQLRVEYDQFELKRRLLTQHDFIMVDSRVVNHVSHILGKMFFKKHNMLIPVRVKENEKLKNSIDVGLRTAMLRLNVGETSTILVGHTGMSKKDIQENILALVKQLKEKFPGGEANIRSIALKLPLSLSVPLYVTLRSANTIFPPKLVRKVPKNFKVVEDELSTMPGSRVAVAPDGTVHIKRRPQNEDSDMEQDINENEETDKEVEDDDGEKSE
ncbi:unnamed protein product [Plutella xylostella]|uniref:(diamondback moth) hypothetical protein n=1 Tax=Plutella xylostella TaxID=51655 RepID=A0A8S4D588_PLUXY|nr:unnamed protein product [Plutella xylostella]